MSAERPDNPRCFIPEEQVLLRVDELAKEIEEDYRESDLVVVCVLKGSFVFFSDLIRRIDLPMNCEFLGITKTVDTKEDKKGIKLNLDISGPIEGKDVLIIEDIVESGQTLSFLKNTLKVRKPKSVKVCSLLYKPLSENADFELEYVGFKVSVDEFVVGYGIDSKDRFRGLSYLGAVDRPL